MKIKISQNNWFQCTNWLRIYGKILCKWKKILVVEILQKQFSKWEKYAAMDGHTGEKII